MPEESLDDYATRARAAAVERGLVVIDANIEARTAVTMHEDDVPLETALSIAQAAYAPYVVIESSTFDAAEIIEILGDDHELVPELKARDGQTSCVTISWIINGYFHAHLNLAEWGLRLMADAHAAESVQRERSFEQRTIASEGRDDLATKIEADPRFRAAKSSDREGTGIGIARELGAPEGSIHPAVAAARKEAGDQARILYGHASFEQDEVVKVVREQPGWDFTGRPREQDAIVTRVLLERYEGYAPSVSRVSTVRLAAIAASEQDFGQVTFT